MEWRIADVFVGPLSCPVEWHEEDMKVIEPGAGNEKFVTEARKSLPRRKPVTGPVTIDARGEVA